MTVVQSLLLQHNVMEGNEVLQELPLSPDLDKTYSDKVLELIQAIGEIRARLEASMERRLAAFDDAGKNPERRLKPRFVRLVERLQLSEKERMALALVFINQVGTHFSISTDARSLRFFTGESCW